jgi:prevent-host-death family protein
MDWNVAQAKQHLSEVIREAAHEPQLIYNRNRPVAAVIAAEELAGYRAWKNQVAKPETLFDTFAELRRIAAGHPDPIPEPDRFAAMRPNAFVEMLEEEYPSDANR